jgi:hypothetical protein
MKPSLLAITLLLAMLTGCAGVMPPAKVYSPAERLMQGPGQEMGATGEAKYCAGFAYASQNASAKQQALANIAKVCGGEDKYAVLTEIDASVRYHGAGGTIDTACSLGSGRAILFKCAGDKTPVKVR